MQLPPPDLRDSRVLVFSQRGLSRDMWHASQYEFEDLLHAVDDVTLLAPPALEQPFVGVVGRRTTEGVRRRVGRHRRWPLWPAAAMAPVRVRTQHDVFFSVFHHAHQLAYLDRLQGWRESAAVRVCILVELWTPGIGAEADYLEALRQFDVVYLFNPSTADALAARFGIRTPRYMPMGVDALRLSPLPHLPQRTIDVYSYGRRAAPVHEQLLRLADEQGWTYLYDSLGDALFRDHAEHRALLANMMKRSKYFLTHTINDSPARRERTGGEEALSTRYFEGVAGGAVLLGSRPSTPLFDDAFPWDDVVIPLAHDGDGVEDIIAELERTPDRVAQIRADNVAGALERHDWAHRWKQVLGDLRQPVPKALDVRIAALTDMAECTRAQGLPPDTRTRL